MMAVRKTFSQNKVQRFQCQSCFFPIMSEITTFTWLVIHMKTASFISLLDAFRISAHFTPSRSAKTRQSSELSSHKTLFISTRMAFRCITRFNCHYSFLKMIIILMMLIVKDFVHTKQMRICVDIKSEICILFLPMRCTHLI